MRNKKPLYILLASILTLSLCSLTACDRTISFPKYIEEFSETGNSSDDSGFHSENDFDEELINKQVADADKMCTYLRSRINYILTCCDTAGFGMKTDEKNTSAEIEITIENSEWTIYAVDASTFKTMSYCKWGATLSKIKSYDNCDMNYGEGHIARELILCFPEIVQGSIWCYCEAGECKYVIFTATTSERISTLKGFPSVESFDEDFFTWDGKTEGVTTEGYIVGTCPKLIQNIQFE